MPLIDLASDIGTAGKGSKNINQFKLIKSFLIGTFSLLFELNYLRAWTIRTSTDSVRMSVAWAQLIHINLVTFFAGNSPRQELYFCYIQGV